MSKDQKSNRNKKDNEYPGYRFVKAINGISEYTLKSNGLTVLHQELPKTGIVTTNITYLVGSKDESRGETGLAHMLEHMLFKPTKKDLEQKIDSGAMQFERETGCILNANTWLDRTTYFFSYPKEHLVRALEIEADRMTNVILTNKEFKPEQGNVLSEFDMYFGDPHFALDLEVHAAAFLSHPYGHETIGFREDIEAYTPEKLDNFYKTYYRPDNAVMMVVGDISLKETLEKVRTVFGDIKKPNNPIPRHQIQEPKQQGIRRVTVNRKSDTNLITFGIKHTQATEKNWYLTYTLLALLTKGPESILQKAFVDTGRVTDITSSMVYTKEPGLAALTVTLTPETDHTTIEKEVLERIHSINKNEITNLLKKYIAQTLTDEAFGKQNSLSIVRELTEYWAAGDWTDYTKTEKRLRAITPQEILKHSKELFSESNLTIGYFIGAKAN